MSYAYEFFDQVSGNCINRATDNLRNSIRYMTTPYSNLLSNLRVVGYPVYHAFQFFIDLCGFGRSLFRVIESLMQGRQYDEERATEHMALFAAAAVLEIANIVLSVVSLAARFLASVLHLGYVSTRVEFCDALGLERRAPDSFAVTFSAEADRNSDQDAFRLVF